MEASSAAGIRPLFLRGRTGRIFGVYYPATARPQSCAYVYVPPFAEEMNRARRTAALQARALAEQGSPVLVLDLFGTGDSEGNFRDAGWQIWLDDIAVAADWLEREVALSVGLWGLRLGALLAATAAARLPDRFRRLLLWQPVADGRTMLTQFLRMRIAAALQDGRSRETTDGLRVHLATAGSIEVAGYEVAAELAQALDAQRLDTVRLTAGAHVGWFEIGGTASDALSPLATRTIEQWRAGGVIVTAANVAGDQVWAVEEAIPPKALIEASSKLAAAWQ